MSFELVFSLGFVQSRASGFLHLKSTELLSNDVFEQSALGSCEI